MVTNINGTMVNFPAAVALMDADICEQLNAELAPCSNQEFFTAYEAAHAAKYGEAWELSSEKILKNLLEGLDILCKVC